MEAAGSLKERKTEANLGKWPFWRMQENVAKHGEGLRDGLQTGSEGDAAQSPVFLTDPRGTLAHVICRHYSPSTLHGRRQQVVKKTGRGKNRCRANNGHKSKCTRRDKQSITITDKMTGITTLEPKIHRIKAIVCTATPTCSVSSCIRNFHYERNTGGKFPLRDRA